MQSQSRLLVRPIGAGYGAEWMPLIETFIEAADDALN